MDGNDIAKVLGGAGLAVAGFFAKYAKRPIEEKAEMLADAVKEERFKKQVEAFRRMEEYAREQNIKLGSAAIKVLLPLLEGVSFEEDETLQEMYARLLAGTLEEGSKVSTTLYSSLLSQMTRQELLLLVDFYENQKMSERRVSIYTEFGEHTSFDVWSSNFRRESLMVSLGDDIEQNIENLIRLRLISEEHEMGRAVLAYSKTGDGDFPIHSDYILLPTRHLLITNLARTFLDVCRVKEAPISGVYKS